MGEQSTYHNDQQGVDSKLREGVIPCIMEAGKRPRTALCSDDSLSVVGRMGSRLEPNDEGLMNAFSVTDNDLGVQPFNRDIPIAKTAY